MHSVHVMCLCVKLVEFSITHISCIISCIELKLGTNDEEGITEQIIIILYFNARNFFKSMTLVCRNHNS